jgi:hypothetical protein
VPGTSSAQGLAVSSHWQSPETSSQQHSSDRRNGNLLSSRKSAHRVTAKLGVNVMTVQSSQTATFYLHVINMAVVGTCQAGTTLAPLILMAERLA